MNSTVAGWVDGPNNRGTLDIIWSCLTTLFICLWASWHEDIPRAPRKTFQRYNGKLKCMLILLLAPEIGVFIALGQLLQARDASAALQTLGFSQWTQVHCMFANMGGIRLDARGCNAYKTHGDHPVHSKASKDECWCNDLCIRAADLLNLARMNILPSTPPISPSEIADRGKADEFVKAIALVQALWLVIQCISRASQKLAVSELEVVCLAYVFYCVLIYLLWWQKPLDATAFSTINVEHTIELDRYYKAEHTEVHIETTIWTGTKRFSEFLDTKNGFYKVIDAVLIPLLFAVIGAIHCCAWNNDFPTSIERWFWRGSSLILMCLGPLLFGLIAVYVWVCEHIAPRLIYKLQSCLKKLEWIVLMLIALYIIARLYVLAEAFASLRSAPASMYKTVNWSGFVPHIS